MKVLVAQKGAREHYLAARALSRAEKLAVLFTDWYAPQGRVFKRFLRFCGKTGKRMLTAKTDELSHLDVKALRWQTIIDRLRVKFFGGSRGCYEKYLWENTRFDRQVATADLPSHDVLFIYSYAALEAMEEACKKGVLTVLDQIDPGPVEFRLVAEEAKTWPTYVQQIEKFPDKYFDKLKKEWHKADIIVVNSEWSRDALIAENVPSEKIHILPLAYELKNEKQKNSVILHDRIRILWLGQVNIRKGIQYLVEAARLLLEENVEFIVAGPIQIKQEAIVSAPANIQWLGSVTRDKIGDLYRSADVFVLPTISDGFAITQLEAMAYGLPVIATPNCGQVVENGCNGFLVPPRNASMLADAILKFVTDPRLSLRMKPACLSRAKEFTIEAYGQNLLDIIGQGLDMKEKSKKFLSLRGKR